MFLKLTFKPWWLNFPEEKSSRRLAMPFFSWSSCVSCFTSSSFRLSSCCWCRFLTWYYHRRLYYKISTHGKSLIGFNWGTWPGVNHRIGCTSDARQDFALHRQSHSYIKQFVSSVSWFHAECRLSGFCRSQNVVLPTAWPFRPQALWSWLCRRPACSGAHCRWGGLCCTLDLGW